ALENSGEMRCIIEPNQVRNCFNLHVSVPKKMLCNFDAHSRNELSRRHVEVGPEEAGKMARRHADRQRDGREGQGPSKVIAKMVEGATDHGIEAANRSEEHTSELQSRFDLVCR